jgi:hypothetical protein
MKLSFFGPIGEGEVIRKSIADVYLINQDSDKLLETITINPNPLNVIGLPDSDYGFDTEIDLAFDSA